eukprot:9319909-Pyramimonas_sp.AAC.1
MRQLGRLNDGAHSGIHGELRRFAEPESPKRAEGLMKLQAGKNTWERRSPSIKATSSTHLLKPPDTRK